MVATWLALAASAGAAGEGTATAGPQPGAPAELQGTARDFDSPPPGLAADQSLWRAAYEANNRVALERGTAARLQQRARAGQYQQRLDALVEGNGDAARRAAGIRSRFLAEWARSFEIAARPWPVDPTRACRYPMLNFEGAMVMAEGAAKTAQLSGARRDLTECLDRARLATDVMARSNGDFQAVIGEVEEVLSAASAAPASRDAAPAEQP